MKKIAVIVAMDKEFALLGGLLTDGRQTATAPLHIVEGRIGACEIILAQCGIGKANAAMGAALLVSGYKPDAVVSSGVAGGADTGLRPCDVVVARETAYHDAYCGSEAAYGQIIGSPARFEADGRLLDAARRLKGGTRVVEGLTVTGDWFVDSRDKMRDILSRFPEAAAVDMESAAIAQVCQRLGVPFVSFRIISDVPLSDHKAEGYYNFWQTIAETSFGVTREYIELIINS